MNSKQTLAVLFFIFICLLQCINYAIAEKNHVYADPVSAASNHHHHGHGRVQIKVYRGPSDGHEHFAPHGYWVKQPADDYHH